jgi:hypothetical protein
MNTCFNYLLLKHLPTLIVICIVIKKVIVHLTINKIKNTISTLYIKRAKQKIIVIKRFKTILRNKNNIPIS